MSFTGAIGRCLARYATFSGRASRREYWYFVLFLFLGNLAAGLLDALLFGTEVVDAGPGRVDYRSTGPLAGLFSLLTIVPLLAAGWRRMHDTGRSGLYLVYPFLVMVGMLSFATAVAGIGPILSGDFATVVAGGSSALLLIAFVVLLISPLLVLWWLSRPSQRGANQYGPIPREVTP